MFSPYAERLRERIDAHYGIDVRNLPPPPGAEETTDRLLPASATVSVVKEPAETPGPRTGFDEVERLIDGGGMDCGSGLLLLINRGMRRLSDGELLGIRSAEPSVVVDLPVWAELVGHELHQGVAEILRGRGGSRCARPCRSAWARCSASASAPRSVIGCGPAPASIVASCE